MRVIRGITALLLLSASTLLATVVICLLALARLLLPGNRARQRLRKMLAGTAEAWATFNGFALSLYRGTWWEIEIHGELDPQGCYVVNCNHQTWVDIPVLHKCLNRRAPFLRFFLKRQLIWVPVLGIAWWALEFPFMERASRAQLARNPKLRSKDLESARKACEKFRQVPVCMMNFPEGTRFTEAKRDASNSPYRHLLLPRVGGTGQVLYALGDELDALIDVTIVYPNPGGSQAAPTLWQLVSGQVPRIIARARVHDIPKHLRNRNFSTDPQSREALIRWMDSLWSEKDRLIAELG